MREKTTRHLVISGLAISSLTLLILSLAVPIFAQSSSSSPGRYRAQGQYRSQGQSRAVQQGQAWQPSYYHQNKYFQVRPSPIGPPYTGNLSRSNLTPLNQGHGRGHGHGHRVGIAPVGPIYPGAVVVDSQPAPPPQVFIVQPPPAQAPPPPPPPPPAPVQLAPPPPPEPVSNEPGDILLSVLPAGASIHLNDRFLGTGESLAAGGGTLTVRPGVYVLEIDHPDYSPQRLVFSVQPERSVRVRIDLTADRPSRRAQVGADEPDFLIRRN